MPCYVMHVNPTRYVKQQGVNVQTLSDGIGHGEDSLLGISTNSLNATFCLDEILGCLDHQHV